jgi:hypothetical protein
MAGQDHASDVGEIDTLHRHGVRRSSTASEAIRDVETRLMRGVRPF